MSLNVKGETMPEQQPVYGWSKANGWYTIRSWHGIPSEIDTKLLTLVALGDAEEIDKEDQGDGSCILRARYRQENGVPTGGGTITNPIKVEMELIGQEVTVAIDQHPDFSFLHPQIVGACLASAEILNKTETDDYAAKFTETIANLSTLIDSLTLTFSNSGAAVESAGALINMLIRGVNQVPLPTYVFRIGYIVTRTEADLHIAYNNVETPHNYRVTGTGARSSSLESEIGLSNFPAEILSALGKIVVAGITPDYYTLGWAKKAPTLRPTPLNQYAISQEYWLGRWHNDAYEVVA